MTVCMNRYPHSKSPCASHFPGASLAKTSCRTRAQHFLKPLHGLRVEVEIQRKAERTNKATKKRAGMKAREIMKAYPQKKALDLINRLRTSGLWAYDEDFDQDEEDRIGCFSYCPIEFNHPVYVYWAFKPHEFKHPVYVY